MVANPEIAPTDDESTVTLPDFERLFSEQVRYLWNTLRRLGIRECDLEDLAHEVLLRVHAQLSHRDPQQPIRPWIFNLALGMAANYRRLARHRTELQATPPEAHDPNHDAEQLLIVNERRAVVQRALEQVPLQHRAVLILHDMDETSIPEIATALGIGVNTAYSRLRLGRTAFRRSLEQILARGGLT